MDLQWGQAKFLELAGSTESNREVQIHGGPLVKCNLANDCNDGDAFATTDGTAYIAIGLPNNPTGNLLNQISTGGTEMVEYFHSMQQYFYALNNSYMPSRGPLRGVNEPPIWLNLAGEDEAQLFYALDKNQSDTFTKHLGGGLQDLKQYLPNVSQNDISEYLDLKNLNNYWSDYRCCIDNGKNTRLAHVIGSPLLSIFVAMKGPGVMLDFHQAMSAGLTFEEEFKKEFGLSWTDAEPTLASIVWDRIQNNY
jgi:hypothetical protein